MLGAVGAVGASDLSVLSAIHLAYRSAWHFTM
jgi:hypothetical protein